MSGSDIDRRGWKGCCNTNKSKQCPKTQLNNNPFTNKYFENASNPNIYTMQPKLYVVGYKMEISCNTVLPVPLHIFKENFVNYIARLNLNFQSTPTSTEPDLS